MVDPCEMENRYSVSAWAGSAAPGESVGRALVLPGGRYTVDQPLLFWACDVLVQAGWRVVTMRWNWTESDEPRMFVEAGTEQLDREAGPAATTLVVGDRRSPCSTRLWLRSKTSLPRSVRRCRKRRWAAVRGVM
jgi:hypothetical protein